MTTIIPAVRQTIFFEATSDFDVEAIAKLNIYSSLWDETQRRIHRSFEEAVQHPRTQETLKSWTADFNRAVTMHQGNAAFHTWVATLENEPVGFIQTSDGRVYDRGHTGLITNLSVHPDCWGHGIGRRLLNNAETHLRDSGLERGKLYVEYGNKRARRLYQANGWEKIQNQVLFGDFNGRTAGFLELTKDL